MARKWKGAPNFHSVAKAGLLVEIKLGPKPSISDVFPFYTRTRAKPFRLRPKERGALREGSCIDSPSFKREYSCQMSARASCSGI